MRPVDPAPGSPLSVPPLARALVVPSLNPAAHTRAHARPATLRSPVRAGRGRRARHTTAAAAAGACPCRSRPARARDGRHLGGRGRRPGTGEKVARESVGGQRVRPGATVVGGQAKASVVVRQAAATVRGLATARAHARSALDGRAGRATASAGRATGAGRASRRPACWSTGGPSQRRRRRLAGRRPPGGATTTTRASCSPCRRASPPCAGASPPSRRASRPWTGACPSWAWSRRPSRTGPRADARAEGQAAEEARRRQRQQRTVRQDSASARTQRTLFSRM